MCSYANLHALNIINIKYQVLENFILYPERRRCRGKKSLSKAVQIQEHKAPTVSSSMDIVTESLFGLRAAIGSKSNCVVVYLAVQEVDGVFKRIPQGLVHRQRSARFYSQEVCKSVCVRTTEVVFCLILVAGLEGSIQHS